MSELNRRQFVAACACATCPALRLLADASKENAAPIDAGPLDDFKAKGIHGPLGVGRRFFLVNRGGRLYAVSATCTHKDVKLVVKDGAFRCPRHGSAFGTDGRVTKAPARRPLPRYGIRLSDDRHVLVDSSAAYGKDAWSEPGGSIEL